MGSWCPLDSVIQNRSIENLTKVVAPINSNCNIEFDNDYIKKLLKGEIKMEVVKIEGNKAILTNGVATRIIDLEKDYMAEVDVIIADLEEKNIVYRDISTEGEKKFLIKLTNNGERIAKDLCQSAKKQIDRSFSCLTNDEQKSFVSIMRKLISMECEYDTD